MRLVSALVLVCALALPAHANGRAPITNGVVFHPQDARTLFVRTTFGLLVSHDGGCSFRWVCEQSIGYGGTFDPKYAIAQDGTIFATTFQGLRVSRDGGCTFTTATAELAATDPNRIADVWVDALDLAANGDVWVATAESSRPNRIYRSTDNGVTFAARGTVPSTVWWKSVKVAPSDPSHVYIAGYDVNATSGPTPHLLATTDAGETWNELSIAGMQFGSTPGAVIAAVDPADPQDVYVISVESNGNGDRLYRSTDGGTSFAEVLATTTPISGVVIRDATTVLVAGGSGGTFQSTDGGQTFAPLANAPQLGCLGKSLDGTLVGCGANWDPDFKAVAASTDAAQWEKLFRFVELAGPLGCPAGTPTHDVCDQQLWPGLQEQFGTTGPKNPACAAPPVDMVPEPKPGGGCCDAGDGTPLGGLMLGTLVLARALRRRAKKAAPK